MNKRRYVNFIPDIYEGDDNVRYCLGKKGKKMLFCIGINPSSAGIEYSDPTMNAFINISRSKGFDGCVMINPAPYRSEKPKKLPEKPDEKMDTNHRIIEDLFKNYSMSTVLCAWGNYAEYPEWFGKSLYTILELAKKYKMDFVCIRQNKGTGEPTSLSYLDQHCHDTFNNGNGNYNLNTYEPF